MKLLFIVALGFAIVTLREGMAIGGGLVIICGTILVILWRERSNAKETQEGSESVDGKDKT